MEKNIALYPYYYAASSFLGWLPVFFLYFNQILSLQDVLLLEAVYYISVVILEVPTGYFSDLIGRRMTLISGSLFLFAASVFYILGNNFASLAIGQLLFAFHMSLNSGTDTVFHYESLASINKESDYGWREARSNKYGMIAGGTAALLGGILASIEIKLAYYLTSIAACLAIFISLRFSEPHHEGGEGAETNPFRQMRRILSFAAQPVLGWVFFFYVALFAITHIPYEFYQPYLAILELRGELIDSGAPVISGILYAIARYLGAYAASRSMVWKDRFGFINYLLINMIGMILIVLIMGLFLHPVIVGFIALRSFPWAACKAPINEFVTPRISQGQRASYHSFMSLACRFTFFLSLTAMSLLVPEDEPSNWENLSLLLQLSAIAGIIVFVAVYFRRPSNLEGVNI